MSLSRMHALAGGRGGSTRRHVTVSVALRYAIPAIRVGILTTGLTGTLASIPRDILG
jgi:hypothetical protein